MKIMFYINNLRKGGAERVVSLLSNGFTKKGNEVIIVTSLNDKIDYKLDNNIKIIPLSDGKNRRFLARNAFYLDRFIKACKKENPDIVLTFLLQPTYRALQAKKKIKKPIIVSDRNDPKIEYKGFIDHSMMKLLYEKSTGFIFQTREAQRYFSNTIQNKSVIVFNPVDDKFFKTDYKYTGNKTFVNVGRLTDQKNQLSLIKCFQNVIKKYPDYKLNIYGDGILRDELQNYIYENKLNKNIKLCGIIDNVDEEIKDKYAFILSSKYEGMPNALMEAMAIGMPCISTDCPCGGSREIVTNNENGILVNNNDEDALTAAIIDLIKNRDKCEKLAKNAKKSMYRFTEDKICEQWLNYIEKVIKDEEDNKVFVAS